MSAVNDNQDLQKAYALHQRGSLQEAATLYRALIKRNATNFQALHLLGLIEASQGNLDQAKAFMARSLAIRPPNVQFIENYASILFQTADYRAALETAQRGLQLNSGSFALVYLRAISLFKLEQFEEALAQFDKVLLLQPNNAVAYNERGSVLAALERYDAALDSIEKAVALAPNQPEMRLNLGNVYGKLKRNADAITAYQQALAARPDLTDAWLGLGNVHRALNRPEDALAAYDRALALNLNLSGAWLGRGHLFRTGRRHEEALAAYDKAISIDPHLAEARHGRGIVFLETRRFEEALVEFDEALALKSEVAEVWLARGCALHETGQLSQAMQEFDKALSIKPDFSDAISGKIFVSDFAEDTSFEKQQTARKQWWHAVGDTIHTQSKFPHENTRDPQRRIRVGYVSADFLNHSAALSFKPVLLNHDKTHVEITCYSSTRLDDACTDEFRRAADRWRDAAQSSDQELAEQIQSDGIDVLVDLSGHSDGNRLGVFARKPAPIQVSAWGHATGTGLPTIDYLFSDPVACPAQFRTLFAEKIFDLPCFISIDPMPEPAHPAEPPLISKGFVTFGVFNRATKVSDEAIALWARILDVVPRSQILFKHGGFDASSVRTGIADRFAKFGTAPERIQFLGFTSRTEHLAAFERVDISLDPFPNNGGISTWESLQMGVPVVAKLGNGIASRAGGAIVSAVSLGDWVAESPDGYLTIAQKFAAMPEHLKTLRANLPATIATSAAGNSLTYTRAVEAAYRQMWIDYCQSG